MSKIHISIALIFFIHTSVAQEYNFGFSYKYLYSKQWDNMIQTYNFSRPFLSVKQPLFKHGLNGSATYIFKSNHHIRQGIHLSYSYLTSSAKNPNFSNTLNLHFIHLGYVLHHPFKIKRKLFYSDCIISAAASVLNRRINGSELEYTDDKTKSYGIGGEIDLKLGYRLQLKKLLTISSFILIGYAPCYYSPNQEVLINQTKGLAGKSWGGLFNSQIGIALHFDKSK